MPRRCISIRKELSTSEESTGPSSFVLFDPDSYYNNRVSGFYRLKDQDEIILGGKDSQQQSIPQYLQEYTGTQTAYCQR